MEETAELDADTFYNLHLPNGLDNLASATMVVGETYMISTFNIQTLYTERNSGLSMADRSAL